MAADSRERVSHGGRPQRRLIAAAASVIAVLLALPLAAWAADGKLTTAISTRAGGDAVNAVAIQSDGKIVVAGQASGSTATGTDFTVARYNTNGTLDTSFGGDGIVTTAVSPGAALDDAKDVAIQGDGKIVVVGAVQPGGSGFDFGVVRYTADGSLDTGFGGGDGIFIQAIGAGTSVDIPNAVAIKPDTGTIVAAGTTNNSTDFALLRLDSSGSLDLSFDGDGGSGNGIVTVDLTGSIDQAEDVALETDGQMVVAGFAGADDNSGFVRLNTDGTLDVPTTDSTPSTDFSTDGIQVLDLSPAAAYDEVFNVAVQADGKIVASGEAEVPAGDNDIAVVRLTDAGVLDTSFDGNGTPGNGIVITSIAPLNGFDGAFGMDLDATGILVAAYTEIDTGGQEDFALLRYKQTDGTLDTAFDTDGVRLVDIVDNGGDLPFLHGLAVRSGTAVAAGRSRANNITVNDFGLIRFDAATGVLDTGFDGDTTAPETSFVSGPANGGATSDTTPSFGFGSNETVPAYGCSLDGALQVTCSQTAGHDVTTPLADGPHTLVVQAFDRYGNSDATPASRTFTVDTADPQTSVSGRTRKRSRRRRARFTFTLGSSDAGSSFRCKLDAGAFVACTSPFSRRVKRGKHTLTVEATDRAGNVDPSPALIVFRLLRRRPS